MLYVCNVEEASADKGNEYSAKVMARARRKAPRRSSFRPRSKARSRCCRRPSRRTISTPIGLAEPGLNRVIRAGYELLASRHLFHRSGRRKRAPGRSPEARARRRRQASSTRISKKASSAAETIAYDDYVALNGEAGARDAGKLRLEGKDYVVQGRRRPAFPLRQLSAAAMPDLLHYEDFAVGQDARTWRLSGDGGGDQYAFAREFDPQPFHLDEERAKASVLGGLWASGWHTCAHAHAHDGRWLSGPHRRHGLARSR